MEMQQLDDYSPAKARPPSLQFPAMFAGDVGILLLLVSVLTNQTLQLASLALAPSKGRTDSQEGSWSAPERPVENWRAINSRRNAKWWYAAFHNVTAMVGAGVLSLPFAMSELGWSVSIASTLYLPWRSV